MNATIKRWAALCLALISAITAYGQNTYRFDHGPYIQGLTPNQVHVLFSTSANGLSYVELRNTPDGPSQRYTTTRDGLIEANNKLNNIRAEGLEPATQYQYRLISKEIVDFQPYKVTFGDSIASPWYAFTTPDPAAQRCAFIAMSDIHDDAAKYRKLLSLLPLERADAVFLVGDIMNYYHTTDQPYTSFIDPSVELFATAKPFVVVRGNHETRGHLAREYRKYVQPLGDSFYGLYRMGDTAIIMLDSGEDKPDSHPVYAGLTAFDDYRQQQVEWLTHAVESDEFTGARHRIVMVHIPPILPGRATPNDEDYATQQIYELFMPILNRAGIDLMISGHTHRQMFLDREQGVYNFPVVINDNHSASFVEVTPEGVHIRTVNTDGEVTLDRSI